MKAEMRNLLDRLKDHPNLEQFQNLIVFPSGQVSAVYRNGSLAFPDLDAVEQFAYPDAPESVAEPSRLSPEPEQTSTVAPLETVAHAASI